MRRIQTLHGEKALIAGFNAAAKKVGRWNRDEKLECRL
jgi:hypothetical protein